VVLRRHLTKCDISCEVRVRVRVRDRVIYRLILLSQVRAPGRPRRVQNSRRERSRK